MRILLIDPPFNRFTCLSARYFPTGLAYLAGVLLREGHEVRIYQPDIAQPSADIDYTEDYRRMNAYVRGVNDLDHAVWREVTAVLEGFRPDLVGISAITPKFASGLRVADLCKTYDPRLRVLMGGAHPTVSPEQTMEYANLDVIVRGEGERAIVELVYALESGMSDISGIRGISYRLHGQVVHNPPSEFISDLTEIPNPARDCLMNVQNYSSEDMGMLLTSRGCPFKCSYCYHPWKGKVHYRSIADVVGEIEEIKGRFGTRQFAIKDDTFTVKRSHVEAFCEVLINKRLDINWDCTTRVDRVDEGLLKLMIRAGCNVIKVGVETGSQRILDSTFKGTTLEQARTAARLFNKHEIFWTAYFMMGLPDETEADIVMTHEFMREINPCYAGLGIYEPFRHTELFDRGVEMGLLHPEVDIEHFFVTNPKDYYFIDPQRRVVHISAERFSELTAHMMKAFHEHNTRFGRLVKRGWARRKTYSKDLSLMLGDGRKALSWWLKR